MFLQTGNRFAKFPIFVCTLASSTATDSSSFLLVLSYLSILYALTCALDFLLSDDQQWFVFDRTAHKNFAQTVDQNTSIGQVASDAARNFVQN